MINVIKSICKFLSPKFHSIHLEYKVNVIPRYGHGKPAHDLLHEIINQNRKEYENNLNYFMNFSESIQAIKNINTNFRCCIWVWLR